MILHEALHAVARRARRPAFLGAMVLLVAAHLLLVSFSRVEMPIGPVRQFFLPLHALFQAFLLVAASPLPWQWTGDDRRMTPVLRGLAQALAFLALPWLSSWALGSEPQASAPATRVVGPLLQACLFASVGWFIAKREAHASELAELRLRTQEAAWTQLRAQLSPHVLLNALNGLAQLVVEDAARAAQGMRDLADVHRRLVAMAQCETVLLREERALTERYLAVESMRLEGRLSVEWDWSQELDSISVLPFLLQPLVENAIKHGIAPAEQDGKLCISGAREGGMLRIVV